MDRSSIPSISSCTLLAPPPSVVSAISSLVLWVVWPEPHCLYVRPFPCPSSNFTTCVISTSSVGERRLLLESSSTISIWSRWLPVVVGRSSLGLRRNSNRIDGARRYPYTAGTRNSSAVPSAPRFGQFLLDSSASWDALTFCRVVPIFFSNGVRCLLNCRDLNPVLLTSITGAAHQSWWYPHCDHHHRCGLGLLIQCDMQQLSGSVVPRGLFGPSMASSLNVDIGFQELWHGHRLYQAISKHGVSSASGFKFAILNLPIWDAIFF